MTSLDLDRYRRRFGKSVSEDGMSNTELQNHVDRFGLMNKNHLLNSLMIWMNMVYPHQVG